MLVHVDRQQARAILGAMRHVATNGSRTPPTDMARRTIAAAARTVFPDAKNVAAEDATACGPRDLAAVLCLEDQAMWAVRFLAVTALVDGMLDTDKIGVVLAFAAALHVRELYLTQLSEAAKGNLP